MDKEVIFDLLLKKARLEILKEFNWDSCIVSTAVCIDVFKHFGIEAEPLPVRAMVFNKAAMKCIERFGWPKGNDIYEWSRKYGAWSVGIGYPKDPSDAMGYVGHLVALVGDELIDLSLDQANRPQYKMMLGPVRVSLTPGFKERKQRLVATINSCSIAYEQIANTTYQFSPDWYKRNRRRNIVARLLEMANDAQNT